MSAVTYQASGKESNAVIYLFIGLIVLILFLYMLGKKILTDVGNSLTDAIPTWEDISPWETEKQAEKRVFTTTSKYYTGIPAITNAAQAARDWSNPEIAYSAKNQAAAMMMGRVDPMSYDTTDKYGKSKTVSAPGYVAPLWKPKTAKAAGTPDLSGFDFSSRLV